MADWGDSRGWVKAYGEKTKLKYGLKRKFDTKLAKSAGELCFVF